jgi:hypothetical protein
LLVLLFLLARRAMTAGRVAKRTPVHPSDVLAALRDAGVPEAAVRMVAAQSAFETAYWTGLWEYNLGNIVQPDTSKPFVMQPGNSLPFRTYATLAAGAVDYVALLTRLGVIQHASEGDLDGYVAALKAAGYAGPDANYDAYKAGMARYMTQLASV